jgi:hypothetical protein
MNRGGQREPIFRDADRKWFLATLAETCTKTDWRQRILAPQGIWSAATCCRFSRCDMSQRTQAQTCLRSPKKEKVSVNARMNPQQGPGARVRAGLFVYGLQVSKVRVIQSVRPAW